MWRDSEHWPTVSHNLLSCSVSISPITTSSLFTTDISSIKPKGRKKVPMQRKRQGRSKDEKESEDLKVFARSLLTMMWPSLRPIVTLLSTTRISLRVVIRLILLLFMATLIALFVHQDAKQHQLQPTYYNKPILHRNDCNLERNVSTRSQDPTATITLKNVPMFHSVSTRHAIKDSRLEFKRCYARARLVE